MQLIKFVLYLLALCAILKECCSSSFIYEVTGNVYPHSYYFVTLNVGDLPRPYNLVIDTGSFFTWIQCDPGVGFRKLYQGPHRAYDPRNGAGLVPCNNEICKYVQLPKIHHCNYASYLCDYKVTYAGGVSSKGVLVADSFTLQYINGTLIKPRLKFGCGYDQEYHGSHILHFDGILGLAKGPESILSQLQRDGATRNILAHCLSAQNGYLFFGDDMIPQGVVWTPMTEARTSQHYIFENVELYFGGLTTGIKGLNIMLDCGSAYSYLIHEAYKALVSMGPHRAYDPRNGAGLVPCNNEICKYVQLPKIHHCNYASYLCDYKVTYAGGVSSKGVLVADSFTLQYINGTLIKPRLKFGCGYDQEYHGSHILHFDGILGLAKGPESILSQLQRDGATRNILAHCLSAQNGYLFFGDDMIPQGVVWTPMTEARTSQHYIFENVELYFGGLTTGIKGLNIMLDCGSAYSYLIHEAYKALVSMLENDIKGNQLESTNEEKFQLCWKDSTPFVSIEDVKELFKPIMLSFENAVDTQFQINPEGYLIITRNGNACFGIKDSATTRVPNINRLGSVSLVDKIIIYDNENHKIGWSAANCNEIPIPN